MSLPQNVPTTNTYLSKMCIKYSVLLQSRLSGDLLVFVVFFLQNVLKKLLSSGQFNIKLYREIKYLAPSNVEQFWVGLDVFETQEEHYRCI